jgi:Holliday junction resolvase
LGRYTYRRPGFLDEIPHVRVIRGVVLVRTEDAGKVTNFLKEFGAEVYIWTVGLRREDERAFMRFEPKSARPTGGFTTSP